MAYSRKPISLTNNSAVGEWIEELNAAITKQNELFNGSNQFAPQQGAILEAPTISGGIVVGTTLSGVSFTATELFNAKLWNPRVIAPTISGGTQETPSISTPSITGGSHNAATFNNPTISGGSYTDPAIVGGTQDSPSVSTPSIVSPAIQTPTISGATVINDGALQVDSNVEITGAGWGIFPNRLGAGRVPNHPDGATAQIQGGLLVRDGIKTLNASDDVTNVWYVSGAEDINIVRNFNNLATLWTVRAAAQIPTSGDAEATLALVRTDDSGNEEFMDIFNNGYHTTVSGVEYGIRIQKRGTGEYRDFAIQYHDGAAAVEDVMRINASGLSVNFDKEVTVLARRVVTVSSGVVFPGTPGFGDEVYRSDLDEWYKYNGSVWTQI